MIRFPSSLIAQLHHLTTKPLHEVQWTESILQSLFYINDNFTHAVLADIMNETLEWVKSV